MKLFRLAGTHIFGYSNLKISFRGALLINQLIEKEMKEQNVQQQAKFDEIRSRTAAIRKQYEEQQKKGGGQLTFQAQTYGQGWFFSIFNTVRLLSRLYLSFSFFITDNN